MSSSSNVLTEYYAAMNSHDVERALTFLHPDVVVTFPEEERNWQGSSVAAEKFGAMFLRMPTFVGSFVVTSCVEQEAMSHVVVTVACRFRCVESHSDSERNMTYHIQHNLITEIHHL